MIFRNLLILVAVALLVACKKPASKRIWVYDDKEGVECLSGNIKEISYSYLESAEAKPYHTVDFDKQGNMVSSAEIMADTSLKKLSRALANTQYASFYSRNHAIEAILGKLTLGNTTVHPKWKFDAKGCPCKYFYDASDSLGSMICYKTDNAGYVTEQKYIWRRTLADSEIYQYKYDARHLLIEADKTNGRGMVLKTIKFQYGAFDSNGNWVEVVAHWNSGPLMCKDTGSSWVTRTITYY